MSDDLEVEDKDPAPTCPECGSPMFPSGYYQWLRCTNYEGCENA